MPKGVYTCQYNGCGKSCMREDGCYRHSEVGRQNKRKAMKVYKQAMLIKKELRKEKGKREKHWKLRLKEESKKKRNK